MSRPPSTPERPTPTPAYPSTPVGFGTAVVPNAFILAGSPTADQFQEEKKQLIQLNIRLKKILDAANQTNLNLGQEVSNLKIHHVTLSSKSAQLETDIIKVMRELELARTSDAELSCKNIVLDQRISGLVERLKALVHHLDEYTTSLSVKLNKKQTEFATLTKEANDLASLLSKMEQQLTALINQRERSIAEMEAARLALGKAKVAKDHLDLEKSNIDTKNNQLKEALATYGGRDVHDWYRDEHNIRVEQEKDRVKKSFDTELEMTKKKIAAEFDASFSHTHQKWQADQKRLADVNADIVVLEKKFMETRHIHDELDADKTRLRSELNIRTVLVERLGAAITKTKEVEAATARLAVNKSKNKTEIDILDKKIADLLAKLGLSAESNQYVALTPEIERYQNLLELADFKMSHTGRAPKVQKTA